MNDDNFKQINKSLIEKYIKQITEENFPFGCEAEFQFYLALKIKENFSNAIIKWEAHSYENRYSKCDLMVWFPDTPAKIIIELKYIYADQKQSGKVSYDARANFMSDVERVEERVFNPAESNIKKGFAIFLTNKTAIYNNKKRPPFKNSLVGEFHSLYGSTELWTKCCFNKDENASAYLLVVEINGVDNA